MDGYESDPTGGDWFCYHGSSPFVFPPGFCDRNNIKLKVLTSEQVGVLATRGSRKNGNIRGGAKPNSH